MVEENSGDERKRVGTGGRRVSTVDGTEDCDIKLKWTPNVDIFNLDYYT